MIDNRMWMLGSSLAIVTVVGLGWMIGISPKLAEADVAIADRESVEAQNASHEATLVALRDQYADLEPLVAALTDVQREVPATPDIETFIDAINAAAAVSGVTVGSITPSEATVWAGSASDDPAAAPADDAADESGESAATDGIYTIPMTMDVDGTPGQVLDFTDAMQTGKRFFLVNSVSFLSGDAETAGGTISGFLLVARLPSPDAEADPAAEDEGDQSTVAAG